MKATLYLIGECSQYGKWGKKEQIKVDRFDFDSNDPDDQEMLDEWTEAKDLPLTQETFENICYRFISESENDWEQRGVPSLIVTQAQMEKLIQIVPTLKDDRS